MFWPINDELVFGAAKWIQNVLVFHLLVGLAGQSEISRKNVIWSVRERLGVGAVNIRREPWVKGMWGGW